MLPLLVAVLLADATPPALSAREIYLRARAAVSAIPLPPYVIFTFTDATNYAVQVVGRRSSARERLRIAVRTSDGHAFVQTLRTWSGYVGRVPPATTPCSQIPVCTGSATSRRQTSGCARTERDQASSKRLRRRNRVCPATC